MKPNERISGLLTAQQSEAVGDKEISCVPYYIMDARPVWFGTKSEREELHQEFLEEGYDEQYWDNFLALTQMSQIDAWYCDKLGNKWGATVFYKVENGKLYLANGGSFDEQTFEAQVADWREFDFSFNGANLILKRNGCKVELTPYEFTERANKSGWYQHLGGYVERDELAYKDIVGISYYNDLGKEDEDGDGYITFSDGGHAIDPVFEVGDNGTIHVNWEEVYRPYNGRSERFSEQGSIDGGFINCGKKYGMILIADGVYYRYQYEEKQYRDSKLSDVLGDTSVSNMSDQQVEDLISKQSDVLEDLDAAFAEAGVEADIDSSTGKVTLDSNILFAFDDATLSDAGKAYLDGFFDVYSAVVLNEKYSGAISEILIEGHTDTSGEYTYNMTLSARRAQAVADYCLSKRPELEDFIVSRGRADDSPVYDENGNVNMAASRRVVFKFILSV